ncbi:MAG TPA: MATE family efflux transporter [Herpetosiphon sp.]|uniref:Multidrug export protein MepA n=1 Tax=Herpetosiphon aurantiacus (strain ATCC 23779 / DSM 785 / 114-95) TaxID=316274 RepID=A9AV33_HERA2|nr:MATE family efflux transporter [Herpetosiphon sp.]ABX03111.1 MATE efflux family protein [Herpetosiphon aurantiacus DSM 785]HBW50787.1 MATE family efflux transporter [Herpetosiphon sp.]
MATASIEKLGTAPIGKLLLAMSSQTTISLLVYTIYSITNTYVLSIGINGLAAAGAAIIAPVLLALGAVSTTVGAGGASVVSRALGAHQPDRAARVVANTFIIFWAAALIISVIGTLAIEPIVYLLGATESIAPYAIDYGRIIFLGAITSTGYSAIIRADGNTGFSTAIWIIPVSLTIGFWWLLVIVFPLGMTGAAIATVLGQAASAGMSIYFFFFRKQRSYNIRLSYFKPDWAIMREILLIGSPSLIKNLSASIMAIVTNNLLRTLGGTSALSVFAIVGSLYSGLMTPQTGIIQGMQPIVGYNLGQRNLQRVWQTIKLSLRAAVGYGLLISSICLIIPSGLISLLSHDQALIAEGQTALRLLALAYPLTGISLVSAAALQAAGWAKQALLLLVGSIIGIKLPILLLGSQLFGLNGIWAAEAISELLLCGAAFWLLNKLRQQTYQPLGPEGN